MREVNFSIPSANKASVGITTALYDRRALDCTSTLPIINSLNHLAYLTTSSARIREILTVDGGLERLVCILKNGRSKDMMETWKWNLAFQCVVNIGVRGSDGRGTDSRGSENIRTRVVEADMVPVVATILDNYMQVIEKAKAAHETSDVKRSCSKYAPCKRPFSRTEDRNPSAQGVRGDRRRQAPNPLDIPSASAAAVAAVGSAIPTANMDITTTPTPVDPDTAASIRPLVHLPFSPLHQVNPFRLQHPPTFPHNVDGLGADVQQAPRTLRPFDIDAILPSDRLPSGSPATQDLLSPRPGTPITPSVANLEEARNRANLGALNVPRSRAPVHSAVAVPEPSDLAHNAFIIPSQETLNGGIESRVVSIEDRMDMVEIAEMEAERAGIMGGENNDENIEVQNMGNTDAETFNITHRTMDGSIEGSGTPTNRPIGLSPAQTPFTAGETLGENAQPTAMFPRMLSPDILALGPRDEDVIMSLQLLAYVSKYCHLRPYFQQSHLVPKLKIGRELSALDGEAGDGAVSECNDEADNDNEYLQADDYNIFPLVEKFTVRQNSTDMKYWAGVVMRNLCRKDKSRGDIRQCAYYKCGKWEEYARQFAKCRRCRQTKYCSKECQKSAWPWHRYWCQPANGT